eukprot:TRINITY_DN2648_c0_g2_i3.p1 TRINITY_DN2648_c0_g2~~TRINITY_DN2648_c0_g2_i3.p1  ORF type:complete len:672 (+),score=163.35 TRINITY_DN2648_c0_g2_i3:114-2129(+)
MTPPVAWAEPEPRSARALESHAEVTDADISIISVGDGVRSLDASAIGEVSASAVDVLPPTPASSVATPARAKAARRTIGRAMQLAVSEVLEESEASASECEVSVWPASASSSGSQAAAGGAAALSVGKDGPSDRESPKRTPQTPIDKACAQPASSSSSSAAPEPAVVSTPASSSSPAPPVAQAASVVPAAEAAQKSSKGSGAEEAASEALRERMQRAASKQRAKSADMKAVNGQSLSAWRGPESDAVVEDVAVEDDVATHNSALDVTLAFEEEAAWGELGDEVKLRKDPVLSLVSINPRVARSLDIARGPLTEVVANLPDLMPPSRTLQISCGRDPRNPLVVKDSRVSSSHFVVRVRSARGGRVVALDILDTSTNGTLVNGKRLGRGRRMALHVGDRITVLPASQVGADAEVAFLLVRDTRGAGCSSSSSSSGMRPTGMSSIRPGGGGGSSSSSSAAGPGGSLPSVAEHAAEAEVVEVAGALEARRPGTARGEKSGGPDDGKPLPWDALEKDLQCGVCITPLHKCLTLVPCGHNFCSVCFVRWRRRSPCCPECRATVKQAVRNLAIDCVVEAFSQANPEAARSKQDTAAMERAERDPGNQAVLKWLLRGDPADVPQSHLDRQNLSNVPTPARNRIAGARTEGGQQGQQQGQPGRRRPSSAGSSNSSACVIS